MSPLASLGALLVLTAFGVAAWGWGRMALAACRLDTQGGAAYLAVLGLAVLTAIGGWLNLFGLAYAPVLWGLLVAGWIEALRRAVAARRTLPSVMADRRALVPVAAVALAALALSMLLLPSAAFNPFDDLLLYFPRPVRMLQAGSLAGNPFDLLGFDSLGVHAFLQAFPLLVLPVAYFNAFDAVLCAVLVLALVASTARTLQLGALVVLGAFVAVAFIPARQVNVSSAYVISTLALALAPASRTLLDVGQGALWRRALPLGLLLAALAGSKATTLPFLLAWGGCFLVLAAAAQGWRGTWRGVATAAVAAAAFLLPWIALHAGNYAAWIGRRPAAAPAESTFTAIFSGLRWSWAGTVPEYHAIAAIVLAAGAAAVWRSRASAAAERTQVLALAALCAAAAFAYAANTQLPIDIQHAMRYSAPALIAAVPAAVLLVAYACGAAGLLALAIPVLLGFLLAGPARERLRNALDYRSVLVFAERDLPQHRVISEWGFARETREWLIRGQAQTRPGEVILAFVLFPHHLLFARNPVLVASPTGLTAPWLDVPPGAGAREFREFLARYRVRYVLWHASGGFQSDAIIDQSLRSPTEGERLGGRRLLWFRSALDNLARSSAVVHAEDGLIVIDLAAVRAAPR